MLLKIAVNVRSASVSSKFSTEHMPDDPEPSDWPTLQNIFQLLSRFSQYWPLLHVVHHVLSTVNAKLGWNYPSSNLRQAPKRDILE